MREFVYDLRYGWRMLLRMRGAGVVAILTLTLGIGATTTIFSVVYAALLRPLPFADPDRLAVLYTTQTTARYGTQRLRWSHAEITALGSQLHALEGTAAFSGAGVALDSRRLPTDTPDPEQVDGEIVSASYFQLLHIAPERGRVFAAGEDSAPGRHPVALISARLWRRRFASDANILDRSVQMNQVPLAIVGVMPDRFSGLTGKADFWIPIAMAPRLTYVDYLTTSQHFINLVGRLRAGVSIETATAELEALGPHIATDDGKGSGERGRWSATMWPLARAHIDAGVRRSVLLLLGAVTCVLAIACVNVASLLLARAGGRRREIAIRLAVGSSRGRIVRQLLAESLLLALIASVCGTLLAVWSLGVIALPGVIPSGANGYAQYGAFGVPAVDRTVLLFVLGMTVAATVVFGLAPALDTSHPDLVTALKEDGRTTASRSRVSVLAGLVVSEVALAVLLLVGAGLLMKSFTRMQNTRTGFVADNVLSFWVDGPASRYTSEDGPAFLERVLAAIERVPGVVSVGLNRCTPFMGGSRTTVSFPDRPPGGPAVGVGRHYVSSGYFQTLGIPLLMGRGLTNDDRRGRPPVTVINEAAARRFWPGENPIGRHLWFGSGTGFASRERPVEVVGVVGDVKYWPIDEPVGPDFYTSYLQFAYPQTMVMMKADNPTALLPALRRAVASVDAGLPIYDIKMVNDRVGTALSRPRFNAAMIALFAGAALILAAVGVYGVMAYSVSSRAHELGVRLALGADRTRVLGLVLRESARLAVAGAAIGLAAAFALTRLLRGLLFDVTPTDPAILLSIPIVIVAVALVAAFVPARRASSVDPMVVLRSE